jgi:CRP/FNR family transcriptional regulator
MTIHGAMMKDKLALDSIARIPYLCVLDASRQTDLQHAALRRVFAPQALIFIEGDGASGLWIIETGQVKIAKLNADGDEYILHLLGAGESFNDIAALENGTNPANATALTEAHCWLIPTETIQHFLATYPPAAHAAIRMLTSRVRTLVQRLEDLALYSVTTRLARFLLNQAETPMIEGGVTRMAIAAHLATTPESISRALRQLEKAGAIRFNRHRIEIIQPDMLHALAFIDPS